eukprot:Colp12_sorted_trinity150504_noHs@26896
MAEVWNQFAHPNDSPRYDALRLVPLPGSSSLFPEDNPCPLFKVDSKDPKKILIRTPRHELRPNSWLKANGFAPIGTEPSGCNYKEATREQACPNSVLAKLNVGAVAKLHWYPSRKYYVNAFESPPGDLENEDDSAQPAVPQ